MLRFRTLIAIIGLVTLVALPAFAADNGFYLGGSVGQTSIDVNNIGDGNTDFSGDDTSYKVFGGYRFLTFLAVEGSYVDLGAPSKDLSSENATYTTDITGYDFYAVGMLPLGIADIFAKAGMVDWDAKTTIDDATGSHSVSDSGSDPAYGVGVQFRIKSFAIRAEVEYFDIQSANNVYMYSVGGSYTF
jgi:hypothetical protein